MYCSIVFKDHFNAHNSFCFHQPVYALANTLPAARRRMYQVAVDELAATVADAEVAPEEVVPRAPAFALPECGYLMRSWCSAQCAQLHF